MDDTVRCWCVPYVFEEYETVSIMTPFGLLPMGYNVTRTILHDELPMLKRRKGRPRVVNPKTG